MLPDELAAAGPLPAKLLSAEEAPIEFCDSGSRAGADAASEAEVALWPIVRSTQPIITLEGRRPASQPEHTNLKLLTVYPSASIKISLN